jgi:hypothetical protein
VEKYAPDVWKRWNKEDEIQSDERREGNRPLVWKEVSIRAGSEVRMAYGDQHHYATIQRGRILDDEKEHFPI